MSRVLQHPVNSIMPTRMGTMPLTAMTPAGELSGALACLSAAALSMKVLGGSNVERRAGSLSIRAVRSVLEEVRGLAIRTGSSKLLPRDVSLVVRLVLITSQLELPQ